VKIGNCGGKRMALFVVFRKTAETEQQVEYSFGFVESQMDRSVVFTKADRAFTSATDQADPTLVRVVGRILSQEHEARTWVGGGAIQS
jgi:hypothetical protein